MMKKAACVVSVASLIWLGGCGGSSSTSTTPTAPIVSLSSATLAFPNTVMGNTSAALVDTVSNTGNATATLTGVTLTGTGASAFASTTTCGSSLAAGASCSVSVTFSPTAATSYSASASINDNATNSPQVVALTGTGVVPTAPIATLSTSTLSFSSLVGISSAAQTVTLTDTGNGALGSIAATIIGTNASLYSISANTCGTTLASAASCAISVVFKPTVTGSSAATLSIADSATGSPQVVALSGTGTAPAVSLSTTSVSLGTNLVGSTATSQPIIVTNTGTGPLTVTSATISGTGAADFAVASNGCSSSVAATATCSISVSFTPLATGSFSATLNIADNAPGTPQTVSLSGSGTTESNSCKTTNTTSPSQTAPTANYSGSAFTGTVMAGSLPVIGASVQIYAAGLTGNGSAPTALGTKQVTGPTGSFTFPVGYKCPYSNSVLYAVATGGQAGSTGAVNAGTVLVGVLGLCNSITANPNFTINEVTTAATAWAMEQFLSAGAKIGSSATNGNGIALAAGTFANLVNILNGTANGANFPATGTAPTARINQVANLLNSCIVSSGATSTACTQLYSLTATTAGTPSNTMDAVMNLVKNPGTNVAGLYTQSLTSTAYSPVLSAAPTDWTMFVTYSGGGMNNPSAVSIDSTGRVWVVNYFSVASLFSNTGAPAFANGVTGNNLLNSYGGGVDVNDLMWIANEESTYSLNAGLGTITLLNSGGGSPATYSAGGLDFPIAVSFDTSGVSWVVDYGNSSMTLMTNSGSPLSGTAGYTTQQYIFPVAVASDAKCNAYVAEQSSNTITYTSADGTTYGSYAMGGGPSGLAVDETNNVWSANYYGNSVGLLSSSGTVLSGSGGYTGGGVNHPQGIAVDGSGTVWVANYRSNSGMNSVLSEFAGATSSTPGTALSPAVGWGNDAGLLEPFAVAIDAAGNLWVTNFGSNTLTEFVGLAAPVKTPLLGPVRVP